MKAISTVAILAVLTAASVVAGEDAKSPPQVDAGLIRRLIAQLDADEFAARQSADVRLTEIGLPAVPALLETAKNGSTEQRWRAMSILEHGKHLRLLAGFRRLAATPDDKIDLEEGLWLIGCALDPTLSRASLERRLDALAAKVRARLGPDVDPARAAPRKVVDAIVHVVFVEEHFTANRDDYHNPQNASLDFVLRTRKGVPIMLSLLVLAVGRRLNVPLVGLQVPHRYMVMYDGSQAPEGQPKDDIIVHCYGGGRIVTPAEIKQVASRFDPEKHLAPSSNAASLTRVLASLRFDLKQAKRDNDVKEVSQYFAILEKAAPDWDLANW
jgi:hypothetical protein